MTPNIAVADAIVVTQAMKASTIAEVFVEPGQVRVGIEVGATDLPAFRNVLPDALHEKLFHDNQSLADRFRTFVEQDFVILAGGERLDARLERVVAAKRVVRDEITGEPLAIQPDDAELVVHVELIYPLPDRPESLTLRPVLDSPGQFAAANIGFVAYHLGIAVNDFRYLSRSETLHLDWSDPWYSKFENRNLRRQFDSPMSAFLYVEHFEVRKEIIIRPKDLRYWIDLGLAGAATIPVQDQAEIKRRAAEFLATRNPVTIDGKVVEGQLDRIHFIRRTLRRTGVIDPPEELDVTSATLGVIFVYPVAKLPQQVAMTWQLFTPQLTSIPAATTDEAGSVPVSLETADPVLRWENFLTNPKIPAMLTVPPPPLVPRITIPIVSVLCAASCVGAVAVGIRYSGDRSNRRTWMAAAILSLAGGLAFLPFARVSFANPLTRRVALSEREEEAILASLLQNIYRAFDRREENLVYDRLALSITGDLLEEVYLRTKRSMELEGQGGARVRVTTVELLTTEQEGKTDSTGFIRRTRWNVFGSVGHWGHTHQRANQYEADFTIEPVDATWKVTRMTILDQQRIDKPL